MSATPASTPNQDATLEIWPKSQAPTFGSSWASQAVADCNALASIFVLQPEPEATVALESGPFVDIAVELVAGTAFVLEPVSGWRFRNFSRIFGGLSIQSCTLSCTPLAY